MPEPPIRLAVALFLSLFLLAGCGGGGGSSSTAAPPAQPPASPAPDPEPEPEPRFSAATLQGSYIFSSTGFEPTEGLFRTIGRFTADGQGGVSGQQENIESSGRFGPFTYEGTYSVDENGRGSVNITGTVEGVTLTTTLVLVVVDENGGVFLDQEDDQVFLGSFRRQTSNLDLARFSGTHVYSITGGNERAIGRLELDGNGAVTGGDQDVNEAGFVRTDIALLSGNYQVDPQTGRTPFRVTSELGTSDFIAYPIDNDEAILMSTDPDFIAAGTLRRQTDEDISTSLLAGPHVVFYAGANLAGSVTSLARVVLAEDGTISDGRITINGGGELLDDVPLTGAATINALGVGQATINYDGITEDLRLLVASADSWVLLSLAQGQLTSGSGVRQVQQDYSNASFIGDYAFGFDQFTGDTLTLGVGDLTADGGGVLTATASSSRFRDSVGFSLPALSISATYATRADGRGTASLPGLSDQIRYYHVDDESILMIGLDPGEILTLGLTRRTLEP